MFSVHSRMITVLEHKLHFFSRSFREPGALVHYDFAVLYVSGLHGGREEAGLYYGFCGPSQALPLQTPPL